MPKNTYNKCPSGKNSYENEFDANKAVRDSLVFKNIKLSYYVCMQCFNYHLTSSLRTSKRTKRYKK